MQKPEKQININFRGIELPVSGYKLGEGLVFEIKIPGERVLYLTKKSASDSWVSIPEERNDLAAEIGAAIDQAAQ